MKTNLKRMATLLLAVVMSLCFSLTAFAAQGEALTSGTLTVTGDQLGGKEVSAVRMFTARATEGENSSIVFDSYELEDAWLAFFKDETDGIGKTALGLTDENPSADQYKAAALAYVQTLDTAGKSTAAEFAHKAQKWYRAKTSATATDAELKTKLTALAVTQTAGTEDPNKDRAVFANLNAGYYLVFPEGGSTGNDSRNTDAMLINIPTTKENTTWNIKSTYPTVDKKVNTDGTAADNGSAQVGDTVTFTLTSKVPDMTDYTTFYFAFKDTLSNGLEYVANSVTVKIGTTEITNVALKGDTAKYEITEPTTTSNELTVGLKDLKKVVDHEVAVGTEITVTYQAKITEAATSTNAATNTVKVEYSNDPTTDTKGESTPDESKVYVYDIDVHKYTGNWDNGNAAKLAGATFVLSKEDTLTGTAPNYENAITLVGSGNSYRVAKEGETGIKAFTTTDTGVITIDGLEVGTYYLHETAAPAGYNKLKAPIEIVISLEDGDYTKPVYTVNGQANTTTDNTIAVENKRGATLPETGGIGTIALTALGVVIVLIGVLVPRKKKNKGQE